MLRVDEAVSAEYEVAGLGTGNRTVDWALGPIGTRRILLDVKRRFTDFFSQMTETAVTSGAAPAHDVQLLFRSVEPKFLAANPDETLQGVWIVTDIKQDEQDCSRLLTQWTRRRCISQFWGTPKVTYSF